MLGARLREDARAASASARWRRRRSCRYYFGPQARLAFGAFQTGFYLTAFGIAINRIELKKDPKAITLLDDFVNKLDPTTQAAGEKAAEPWLAAVKEPKG